MSSASRDAGFGGTPISVIFEVLPTSIQSIIPPLPSLRRTVSGKGIRATSFLTGALFVLQQPPPVAPADGQVVIQEDQLVMEEDIDSIASESSSVASTADNHRAAGQANVSRPRVEPLPIMGKRPAHRSTRSFPFLRLPRRSTSLTQTPEPATTTGIDAKFQRRGQDMLRSSEEELDPKNTEPNIAFARRSYIDGVAYLLQGLPRDLDEGESSILRGALPEPMRRDLGQRHQRLGDSDSLRSSASSSPTRGNMTPRERSTGPLRSDGRSPVHRAVQTIITIMIFFLRLALSFGIAAVQEVVRVGNEYQIPERVTRQTMFMASSFASIGSSAASTIGSVSKASYNLVDDRMPYGLGTILQWLTDECVSGACAGVREGLRCQV